MAARTGNNKPRVLVVTPWFPTQKEPGAGSFVLRDVQLLSRVAEVTVLHLGAPQFFGPDPNAEDQYESFRIVRSPFAITNYRSVIAAMSAIRRELRHADALHTMAYPALPPFRLLRVRVPWLHTEHFSGLLKPPVGNKRSVALQRLLRRQLARPDRVIAVSEYLAAGLTRYRKDEPTVIGNAVPMPEGGVQEAVLDFSQLNLIGVGRITEEKGAHDAVEALIELVHRGYDARLRWLGNGPLEHLLRARAEGAGVGGRLEFLGAVPSEVVDAELQRANVFVLPTRTETFGVALAEAFAAGLPIVTGNRGGFTDFLDRESSRSLEVSSLNGAVVADAVESIASGESVPLRSEIARRARVIFDEDKRLRAYEDQYAQLKFSLKPDASFKSDVIRSQREAESRSLGGRSVAFLLRGVIANDSRVLRTAEAVRRAGAAVRIYYRPGVTGDLAAVPKYLAGIVTNLHDWGIPYQRRNLRTGTYVWEHLDSAPFLNLVTKLPIIGHSLANLIANRRLGVRLRRELSEFAPDLVHAHDANTLGLARTACRGRAPFVYDSHEMWRGNYSAVPPTVMRAYQRMYERRGVAASSGLITVSPSILRWLVTEYRYQKPTAIVRNVPTTDADPSVPNAGLRARIGLDERSQILVYGGAVLPYRGIEESIASLNALSESIHLVIVGYGDETYIDGLRSAARHADLESRVHFLGKVPHAELLGVVGEADVALVCIQPVSPSYRFSLPNKLFESIHAGVPVIASDLPDLAALVREFEIGEVVSEWDAQTLAAAVTRVCENPEQYRSGLRRAAKSLTWEAEAKSLLSLYSTVLAKETR